MFHFFTTTVSLLNYQQLPVLLYFLVRSYTDMSPSYGVPKGTVGGKKPLVVLYLPDQQVCN